MINTKNMTLLLFLGYAFMSANIVHAQSDAGLRPDCRQLSSDEARLACYDALFPRAAEETSDSLEPIEPVEPEAHVGDPEATTGDEGFGLSATDTGSEPQSIEVIIVSWRESGYREWVFITEDGQVWRQKEPMRLRLRGDRLRATIRESVVSGYRMTIEGNSRAVRVERIR